jgi:hypothetical protein
VLGGIGEPVVNEEELNEVRRKIRALNVENMLGWQTQILRTVMDMMPPEIRTQVLAAISTSLEAQKKEYELLPFKRLPPEWADLMSSENHEQFLSICKDIELKLGLANAA